ncbi:MAG: hypothetical protein ACD_50C00309G0005 [uncultured bacterium]|nr:MAG: hypothetical protein ACD_50C00309G0005 [uncultured bacterium]OGH13174.1 MAG: hypothetical protein A2687_05315 [Candidatus Levybacteria bacterium RIFCSPHIGHO2_01_FULL_38_26]
MENNIGTDPIQQPSVPQSSPHSSKTFIILIVVILIAAVGMGGYFLGANQNQVVQPPTQPIVPATQFSPTPVDETANWKTYTNTKVGFRIKYPSRYSKPTVPGSDGPMDTDGNEDNISIVFGDDSSDQITLSVIPFNGNINQLLEFINSPDAEVSLIKSLKADGQDAFWYLIKDEYELEPYSYILFIGKDHGFTLEPQNTNYSKEEIELMLSTFKFTN